MVLKNAEKGIKVCKLDNFCNKGLVNFAFLKKKCTFAFETENNQWERRKQRASNLGAARPTPSRFTPRRASSIALTGNTVGLMSSICIVIPPSCLLF
jgi:hypothetical protein